MPDAVQVLPTCAVAVEINARMTLSQQENT